jgi:hypothetical protein
MVETGYFGKDKICLATGGMFYNAVKRSILVNCGLSIRDRYDFETV